MSTGILLKFLSPLGESSASLGTGWAENVKDESSDLWRGMVSRKSQKGLKNWMLEQLVKANGCSSMQFLLREFY